MILDELCDAFGRFAFGQYGLNLQGVFGVALADFGFMVQIALGLGLMQPPFECVGGLVKWLMTVEHAQQKYFGAGGLGNGQGVSIGGFCKGRAVQWNENSG